MYESVPLFKLYIGICIFICILHIFYGDAYVPSQEKRRYMDSEGVPGLHDEH